MAAGYEMRVSDAEREAAAAEVREHFASGRLNQDELDERLTSVFAAKTRGDLNALFADLPSGGHGWASGSAPGDAYAGSQARGGGRGDTRGGPAGRGVGRFAIVGVLVPMLFLVGILGVFGIGTGRPFGIVLIFAAFALLRRLLFMIFGRRRMGGRGRGPRRRR